jgi:hypothetical protein
VHGVGYFEHFFEDVEKGGLLESTVTVVNSLLHPFSIVENVGGILLILGGISLLGFLYSFTFRCHFRVSQYPPLFPEKMERHRENLPLAVFFHYWQPFSVTRFSCVHPSQRCSVLHGSAIHDPHGQRIVGQFYRKWVVPSPQNMATFWFQIPRKISGLQILGSQHFAFISFSSKK